MQPDGHVVEDEAEGTLVEGAQAELFEQRQHVGQRDPITSSIDAEPPVAIGALEQLGGQLRAAWHRQRIDVQEVECRDRGVVQLVVTGGHRRFEPLDHIGAGTERDPNRVEPIVSDLDGGHWRLPALLRQLPCPATLLGNVYGMSRPTFRHRAEAHPGHRSVAGGLARAAVFGVSDGLVSNVSLVIGFAGAGAASGVVRLAGLAGAIAGATSMAAGEWVSISAQNELVLRELAVERRELARNPASETAELARMYEGHGMTRQIALHAAADVMREPEAALNVHAREELGVDPNELASPWSAAVLSLICFIVGALLPVIPWIAGSGDGAKLASILIGVVAAAAVGLLIGKFAERRLVWSAVRQVLILLVACGATYLVGKALGVSIN